MQINIGDKQYRLKRFPPIVGRKLMTKGAGIHGILDRSVDSWLDILEYVEVSIGHDQWIPLSTRAMLDNHVKKELQPEILTAVLQHNCHLFEALVQGPTLSDTLWAEVYSLFEEAFA